MPGRIIERIKKAALPTHMSQGGLFMVAFLYSGVTVHLRYLSDILFEMPDVIIVLLNRPVG